jgi:hypothetical protein
VSLVAPFAVALDPLVQYVWTGTEPLGLYTAFLAAVQPGSLADGRLDPGDIVALQTGGLSLFPPAQATLDPGQAASAVLSAAGGTLTVTGSAGHQFSLVVPVGALPEATTITLTPVAGLTGLPLAGSLLAAVQLEPAGLRFQLPATLSVTLPGGPPPPGVVGFSLDSDGTGFALQRTGANGATLTMPVGEVGAATSGSAKPAAIRRPTPRQSASAQVRGWGISFCGPEVTSAIGRDACREMGESLSFAAGLAGEFDGLPLPVRVQLAAELITQLRLWLDRFILPEVAAAAADPPSTDPTVDYFFLVAMREYEAVRTILALAEALDPTALLTQELDAVHQRIPSAFEVRRRVANEQCLVDREHYRTYVRRLTEMAGLARRLNGLPDTPRVPEAVGLTCIVINLIVHFPDPVPTGGGEFNGIAVAVFPDLGTLFYPEQPAPTVRLQLRTGGLANATPPTDATGAGEVRLRTMVGFGPGSATKLEFLVQAEVPEFDLVRQEVLTRVTSCVFPPDELPPGSYLLSCSDCQVQGTVVSCQCLRINGSVVSASKDFATCGTELANTDGVLTCGPCPTGPLPAGFEAADGADACDLPGQ